MAETYSVILQYEATNALADAYTVPASTSHVFSTINVCNFTAVATTCIIKIAKAGVADTNAHYISPLLTISAYNFLQITAGITVTATDVIRIQAGANNSIAVNIFGTTIT